jgi:PAS domain S-box-containing protein
VASLFSRTESRALEQSSGGAEIPRRPLDPQRILDLSQDLMCVTDAHGRFVRVGASAKKILGYAPEELVGRKLIDLVHPADVQRTLLAHDAVLRGAQVVEFENKFARKDGTYVDLSWTASWVADGEGSGVTYATARDITQRKRADVLREAYREVLQMIASGSALPEILRRICVTIESFDADTRCAVTLSDAHARGGAISPSLPPRFLTIVQDTLFSSGSADTCGATLRSGHAVICVDMEIDLEWQGISDLASEHGLRACWMTPVFGPLGDLIATVGVFYRHRHEPTRREQVLVQSAASLVAVAIEHARVQTQLKDSCARLEQERQSYLTQLEQRVSERTQELQDSNRELEAFGYSVSHDLRGPLRAIAGFTGLLRDRHYETIDADGRRCIDRVLAGTQRMSNLIDDLLELGRISRVAIRRRPVDLSEHARAILARLRESAPERTAAIVIEPQVWVEGDPGLLEIALENLLDNAWKFTAGRPVAEIRFGTLRQQDEGDRTLFVRDNGVGFDPRYAASLFGVFQRLHAAGEFPGTGVGLATVQRIVKRHGGRIWAEAGVDRGATIYFTIAKGQQ